MDIITEIRNYSEIKAVIDWVQWHIFIYLVEYAEMCKFV